MKTLQLFALAAVLGPGLSLPLQAAPASPSAAQGEVARGGAAAHIAYMKGMLYTLEAYNETLLKVDSKASADAHAPAIKQLQLALKALAEVGSKLKITTEATQAEKAEMERLVAEIEAANMRLHRIADGIPQAAENSKAFVEAVNAAKE